MEWLDEEIEQYEASDGRNICSDSYYGKLLEIRTAQQNGTINDELYAKLNYWFGTVSPERGYYYANIHYDIFRNNESIEDIEDRMIHFLDRSDKIILKNDDWFEFNFLSELRYFISERREIRNGGDDCDFFNKYGNDIEKYLYEEYKKITERNRPIISEINIKYFNQQKRKLEILSISFDKFGFLNVPLGSDGRIFSKKSNEKYKRIDIKKTDSYFDSIYKMLINSEHKTKLIRKEHDEFLSIVVETCSCDENYDFIGVNMYSLINLLSDLLSKEFNEVYFLDFLKPKKS
jgi:hypothetical protein